MYELWEYKEMTCPYNSDHDVCAKCGQDICEAFWYGCNYCSTLLCVLCAEHHKVITSHEVEAVKP